jgi:matrixin
VKRSEAVLLPGLAAVLLAVAAFVSVQVLRAPRRPKAAAAVADASPADAAGTGDAGLSSVRKSSLPPPPPRDYADIARRLAEGSSVTYIDAILGARGGNIARWMARRENPITVWIQPRTTLGDFYPDFKDRARDAFYTWAAAGVPLRFLFVDDSAAAEVHLTWVDRFDDSAAGKTYWERDPNWWIVGANIEIALHRPTGEAYDQQMIRAISLHEVGHLIGLDHSPDLDDIMAPKVRVTTLSPADLRTAALIYELPPGPVAKPAP